MFCVSRSERKLVVFKNLFHSSATFSPSFNPRESLDFVNCNGTNYTDPETGMIHQRVWRNAVRSILAGEMTWLVNTIT